MTKRRCIATTKTSKKCKNGEYRNKLCFQHNNICYKDHSDVVLENTIISNIENTNNDIVDIDNETNKTSIVDINVEDDNCAICLEKNGNKYIKKTCCNYKLHYKCLETFLCMNSTELRCPICKTEYNKDNIKNIFTNYQIIILYNRIFDDIYIKSKIVYNLNKEFSYTLKELVHYERQIILKTQYNNGEERFKELLKSYRDCVIIHSENLINQYRKTCDKIKEIVIDLKKTNIIKKNYSKTVEIYNRNKDIKYRMSNLLISRHMI